MIVDRVILLACSRARPRVQTHLLIAKAIQRKGKETVWVPEGLHVSNIGKGSAETLYYNPIVRARSHGTRKRANFIHTAC